MLDDRDIQILELVLARGNYGTRYRDVAERLGVSVPWAMKLTRRLMRQKLLNQKRKIERASPGTITITPEGQRVLAAAHKYQATVRAVPDGDPD